MNAEIQFMITLETLPLAQAQEVFDQVITHLLTQNEQSLDVRSGGCFYRGPRGLKCAVGCLIADEEYDREWEGQGWRHLSSAGKVPLAHERLISALQSVHDHLTPGLWRQSLKQVADVFGLRLPREAEPQSPDDLEFRCKWRISQASLYNSSLASI